MAAWDASAPGTGCWRGACPAAAGAAAGARPPARGRRPWPLGPALQPAPARRRPLPNTLTPTPPHTHTWAALRRYDALLRALWAPAAASAAPPPGAVGATLNVERVVKLLAQHQAEAQEAAAAAGVVSGALPASQVHPGAGRCCGCGCCPLGGGRGGGSAAGLLLANSGYPWCLWFSTCSVSFR
jgi:hypothetical protein